MERWERAEGAVGGVVAAVALAALVVPVAAGTSAVALPAFRAQAVCQIRALLPLDGRRECGGGPRVVPVADRPDEARARLERRLRRHEEHLNRFWRQVHGGRHVPPSLEIIPGFPAGYRFVTGLWLQGDRATRRPARIILYAGMAGDTERDFAAWLWMLAHEFGHNGQPADNATSEDRTFDELQADCLAGAYVRWARDRGLVSGRTLRYIEEDMASRPPEAGYPPWAERLRWFRQGYERSHVSDPLRRCGG
jgi:hypothetical protein